jgi:plastocyanin
MRTSRTTSSTRGSRAVCLLSLGAATHGAVAGVEVAVRDRSGAPVEEVAVYAVPLAAADASGQTFSPAAAAAKLDSQFAAARSNATPATGAATLSAVMDQANTSFVPHLLIVQTGTQVHFPNNDTVSHHVYSFSEARSFELPLYKGNEYPPVSFDTPGIVVVGCNIHDGMLGYILVVDTPHFALTDQDGIARLDALPDGPYTVRVWTPRARANTLPGPSRVEVEPGRARRLTFEFSTKLMPAHEHSSKSLAWDY